MINKLEEMLMSYSDILSMLLLISLTSVKQELSHLQLKKIHYVKDLTMFNPIETTINVDILLFLKATS